MAKARTTGWLLLADISGYTRFLTGTELEHADAILEGLVRGLLAALHAPLRLVKLEGDAVFAYALDDETPDARLLVDRIEDAYHAFRMQLFNIERSTTCTCAACKAAPSLDLKFMLHHGEFLIHDLAGHDDLQGPCVILVHRLLKNEVVERTGTPAYLLATGAARARLGETSWIEHAESYEHLGEVPCGVRDLHAAFRALSEAGSADVKVEDAATRVGFDLSAPPAVAWDWHMDGSKVVQWQGLDHWTITPNGEGRTRAGATLHCGHGEDIKSLQIVGWRPFSSFTTEARARAGMMPAHRFTAVFTPLDEGTRTHVEWRIGLVRPSMLDRVLFAGMGPLFAMGVRKWAAKLEGLVVAERARERSPRRVEPSTGSEA